ncbi:hypothetical protein CROQUDRAFT_663383 [Cronartium quercuum f. sp. fusiforme G11]|uniref:Uncharacterized protein n=1 Tax=Cronartium quercuum f. sp. fusiforme G11 TaxID=708437 RepID=A0A9P6NCM4_9BASI|nr:hypothetical protein CROQUDRAFT_663383 [Cronartium quercuum f. sp. fusiforme G11]
MSIELEMESEADGALQSPTSSDQFPTSGMGPEGRPQDLTEDTEMHELSDTHSQINFDSQPQNLTNAHPVVVERSQESTISHPNPLKTRLNSSRAKGKMIMVGGNVVESGGGSGSNSRSRPDTRSSNSRNHHQLNEWGGGGSGENVDGHRGVKILDENVLSRYDFGDPFLELYNAQHSNGEEFAMTQPENAPSTDENQYAPASNIGVTNTSIGFVPPLPPSEIIAPNTPAASPS